MKKVKLFLFIFICITVCSCTLPSAKLSDNPDSIDSSSASPHSENDSFPSEEEINSFISPYLLVLDDIKKTYGVSLQIVNDEQKKKLYSHCIGLSIDDFRSEVMTYLGISSDSAFNLPQKEIPWDVDADVIHDYAFD